MMHIASVHFKCFRYFGRTFHMDVAKVDRDITYDAMFVHICCEHLSPMFYLCFSYVCCKRVYLNVAYVSHICCKCFI
jgi:hypothetical protein